MEIINSCRPSCRKGRLWKTFLTMKLATIFVFISSLSLSAETGPLQGTINLEKSKITIEEAFGTITRQLGYDIFYNYDEFNVKTVMEITETTMNVEELLQVILGNEYSYRVIDNSIVISPAAVRNTQAQQQLVTISGRVMTSGGAPLIGATIIVKGTENAARPVATATDANGMFRITAPARAGVGVALAVSYIGYETREIIYQGEELLEVRMNESAQVVDEVVVNGMWERKAESFTGSAVTFKQEDLKRVGNQNIIASLKNLDPSFIVTEDLEFGSDPNRMPEITMRGRTTVPDLRGEYSMRQSNQPYFILDGFEASLQTVMDLDMNRVRSVTLLKDAAAKAIYGDKAGNGVVVIETILPNAGKLSISYNGSLDLTAPDLTSYNLANSAEKLQAEWLSGKFTSSETGSVIADRMEMYHNLQKEVARGVDTYWLSKPLRTGVGQQHSIGLSGGTEEMRYSANVNYDNNKGVMKGSDRETLSGSITLSYRYKTLSFRNNLSVSTNRGDNSPYGSFSDYANMNPYWRTHDENGLLIKSYPTTGLNRPNPLFNASLDVVDKSSYTNITENFYAEWSIFDNLRVTARVGIASSNNDSDRFLPAEHTSFATIFPSAPDDGYLKRGQYSKSYGKSLTVTADAGLAYSISKGKHLIYANALWNISSKNTESMSVSVLGFPSPLLDYITAGYEYSNQLPSGSESKMRSIGVVGSANYSYDNRYMADFSYRASASSQAGKDSRWGHFWSVGLGWNIHNEKFMENASFLESFRIKGSLGMTGSQISEAYMAIATYGYFTGKHYNGEMGQYLLGLPNLNLKWQQQYDRNIGVDIAMTNGLSLNLEYYSRITTNLLTDIFISPSAGFPSYKENLGEMENLGWQVGAQMRLWSNPAKRAYLNIFTGLASNKNKMLKISDALRQINEEQDAKFDPTRVNDRRPVVRFAEGESMSTIWAVRSMGIDPMTGYEVFMKKDGSLVYEQQWDPDDQIAVGDTESKITGNIGASAEYMGLSLNLSFNFRWGGQIYNSTLLDKIEKVDIENVNVDRRVLYDRWNSPGDISRFKSIKNYTDTNPTTRFVEDLNELVFSSVSLGYDLSNLSFIKKSPIDRLTMSFNMNDIGRLSTVEQERGTEYPFARAFSFSLSASF